MLGDNFKTIAAVTVSSQTNLVKQAKKKMLCSVFCFQSFVCQLSRLTDTHGFVFLHKFRPARTHTHVHTHTPTHTLIQTVRREPEGKIATLEFLEENHSAWSQYTSYFRVRQKRMWAGEICRREQSVTGEIRLAKCCSPNYCQVTQAARRKHSLDQE